MAGRDLTKIMGEWQSESAGTAPIKRDKSRKRKTQNAKGKGDSWQDKPYGAGSENLCPFFRFLLCVFLS